jgi:hypothetical protein
MDTLEFSKSGRHWQIALHNPLDLAITMEFGGPQPRFFAAGGAVAAWAGDPWTALVERGVTSLVVDLPSLDRADDDGGLVAHHTYWGLAPGVRDARLARRGHALVTELAYVPAAAADGLYLLDLQVPAFGADAAPSRPVIYRLLERGS